MNLYELSADLYNVLEGGMVVDEESGEILFDADNLEELEMQYADKLEGCGIYVKNLSADIDALKEEERRITERRRIKERKVERMKEYMLNSMSLTDTQKLDTPKVYISQRKSSRVIIEDESAIPTEYKEQVLTIKYDKSAIRKALKDGTVPGATMVDCFNLMLK